jgi:hypothetical protein
MGHGTTFALCVKWEIYTWIYICKYILITMGGISGWCIRSFEWIHQVVISAEPTGQRGCLFGFDSPFHHRSDSHCHPHSCHSAHTICSYNQLDNLCKTDKKKDQICRSYKHCLDFVNCDGTIVVLAKAQFLSGIHQCRGYLKCGEDDMQRAWTDSKHWSGS